MSSRHRGEVEASSLIIYLGPGRGWVVTSTPRPVYPRQRNLVPLVQEFGWAKEPVWKDPGSLSPLEFKPWTVQPEVSRYTKYNIPYLLASL